MTAHTSLASAADVDADADAVISPEGRMAAHCCRSCRLLVCGGGGGGVVVGQSVGWLVGRIIQLADSNAIVAREKLDRFIQLACLQFNMILLNCVLCQKLSFPAEQQQQQQQKQRIRSGPTRFSRQSSRLTSERKPELTAHDDDEQTPRSSQPSFVFEFESLKGRFFLAFLY